MTTATNTATVQLLQEWITGNHLASQYSTYVNTQIRTGDTFYTKLLKDKGEAAAEEALRKWDAQCRRSDFAAGIEPVAKGMLALARIDTNGKNTKAIDVTEHMLFPHCYDIDGPSKMVVVFCSGAFDPYERLGLKAVTLQVGDSLSGNTVAQLGLVLPQRVLDPKDANKDAYTVVTIRPDGFTNSYKCAPALHRDSHLRYALGLIELEQVISCWYSSGRHLDDAVGFPGATDYLANVLPKLGEHFTTLAEH